MATTSIRFIGLSVRHIQRSAAWYARLLDLETAREHTAPDGRFGEVLLREPRSGMAIGLYAHPANWGEEFSEFRTGLDHVEFAVETRDDLFAWVGRLTALGIQHSGIKERPVGALVTFRDPDNIQLEFYWERPQSTPDAPNSPAR